MDFAKKILNKYGWKDGDGLGKEKNGISKPLKANLKFDTAGLGADVAASDFNNHWWERVFNEAANNVKIKTTDDGSVKVKRKKAAEEVDISTKSYSVKKQKTNKDKTNQGALYTNFTQSATLGKDGTIREHEDTITQEDTSVTAFKAITDEELFKICGGRTAHKGARHGLNLSGKLSRIEQQEQEMIAKMSKQMKTDKLSNPEDELEATKESYRKMKETMQIPVEVHYLSKKKKKIKKKKNSSRTE